ncbi:sugar transferase [Acinetobacter apis]
MIGIDGMFKRLIDIIIASLAFLILLPVFLYVTYKVKKNMGSPVFFYQERPGKNGKLFKMIKFRSMKDAYDQDGNALPDDARITPFGQKLRSTSLDEMPQLINVIKGDMSVVGPRPMLKEFVSLYSEEQARRLHVRPGMTGLAQISGRNELDYEERFRLDVWYVDHRNLLIDFKIMFKTVWVMSKKEGVNAPGHVGPSLFKGNNTNQSSEKKHEL